MGWNALRKQIFANQKRLGVIPASTTLTPWPTALICGKLQKWDTLSADEKKLFPAKWRSMPPTSPIPTTRSAA